MSTATTIDPYAKLTRMDPEFMDGENVLRFTSRGIFDPKVDLPHVGEIRHPDDPSRHATSMVIVPKSHTVQTFADGIETSRWFLVSIWFSPKAES